MIQPLFNNIVLKKQKEVSETSSGIVLTQKPKDEAYAVVEAVGNGISVDGKKTELPVSVGDKVIYKKYSGTEIKHEGEEYLILPCEEILAIIK